MPIETAKLDQVFLDRQFRATDPALENLPELRRGNSAIERVEC